MNHVLKMVEPDPQEQMRSYGDASLPLAPELATIGITLLVIIGVVTVSQLLLQDRRRQKEHDSLAKKIDALENKLGA
jgi:hypothetical protein